VNLVHLNWESVSSAIGVYFTACVAIAYLTVRAHEREQKIYLTGADFSRHWCEEFINLLLLLVWPIGWLYRKLPVPTRAGGNPGKVQ